MSAKAIREADGKAILSYFLPRVTPYIDTRNEVKIAPPKLAQLCFEGRDGYEGDYAAHVDAEIGRAEQTYPFLTEKGQRLVAKPDMLIKRRGKGGLLKLDAHWGEVKEWIRGRAGKKQVVEGVTGLLVCFLVEPFVAHSGDAECYLSIYSERNGDVILFSHKGGVDVGDVDATASRLVVPIERSLFPRREQLEQLVSAAGKRASVLVEFVARLYAVFVECQFTFLEINPLVVAGEAVHMLDVAAKLDQTAEFECGSGWAAALKAQGREGVEFPAPWGRQLSREERYIQELDAKTGASLKLTVLNEKGRVWMLVAGGGASVVYADAVAALGHSGELGNYGEYSGAPTETQTYEYAKTVLSLMMRGEPDARGKVLLVGGGIANFTNCATTFRGIIRALREQAAALHVYRTQIWVRRAGPNHQEALRMMRAAAAELGLAAHVYGAEMHVSGVVPLALQQ